MFDVSTEEKTNAAFMVMFKNALKFNDLDKCSQEDFQEAMDGDMSAARRFVMNNTKCFNYFNILEIPNPLDLLK